MKKVLDSKDTVRIKAAKEDLERSMQHIGEAMSKAGASSGQPHGDSSPGGSGSSFGGGQQRQQHQQQQQE